VVVGTRGSKAAKPLAPKFADATRTTAKVRVGNGRNVGLVKAAGHGPAGRGGDTDGVPNAFDIDTAVANYLEASCSRSPTARRSTAAA
jgi:hypothetical protein